MSFISTQGRPEASESQRPLRTDFTQQVLQNAARAKRRAKAKSQFQQPFRELSSMKMTKVLRTAPGVAIAALVIATGSVGAYALSNWFGGNVTVKENSSILSVDLSSCKGNLPPGVNANDNRQDIQFKILGTPHISAANLQTSLLGECESSAVADFYGQKYPDAGFSSKGLADASESSHYLLLPAHVVAINSTSITVSSTGAKSSSFATTTLPLASDLSVYDEGQSASTTALAPGDNVMFVAYSASASATPIEGTTILNNNDIEVLSLFKTQYNDGIASSFDYPSNNITPLDMYMQTHK